MRTSRSRAGALVATAFVALTIAGCGSDGGTLAVPALSVGQPSEPAAPASTSARVQPTFTPPITYSLAGLPARSEVSHANGSIVLNEEPISYSLGFRVQEDRRDNSELVGQNQQAWVGRGVKPDVFEADGQRGFWAEEQVSAADNDGKPGTSRFYVVAKGAVTVSLTAFAPENVAMTEEAREIADGIARSIRFDESELTGEPVDRQLMSKVPYSFEKPAAFTGGDDAEFATMYWNRYEFDGQVVEVALRKQADAAAAYGEKVTALRGTEAEVLDVKEQESTTALGAQVDEGVGTAPRQADGIALMYFIARKGDLLLEVRSSGEGGPLGQRAQEAVTAVVGSTELR